MKPASTINQIHLLELDENWKLFGSILSSYVPESWKIVSSAIVKH